MTDNFSKEFYEKWEHLISDIDIEEVPIFFVREVVVNFQDKEPVKFNIKSLIEKKIPIFQIESQIQNFLDKTEDVYSVDFQLDIEAVAKTVTKKVSKLLG